MRFKRNSGKSGITFAIWGEVRLDLCDVWILEKTVWGVGYGRLAFPAGLGWDIVMSWVLGANPHKKPGFGCETGVFWRISRNAWYLKWTNFRAEKFSRRQIFAWIYFRESHYAAFREDLFSRIEQFSRFSRGFIFANGMIFQLKFWKLH